MEGGVLVHRGVSVTAIVQALVEVCAWSVVLSLRGQLDANFVLSIVLIMHEVANFELLLCLV